MRIWLSKNSEVPLREQLATQIILGIVSDDLKPGQKLPSTRELARRYDIHSNTVSAAYQDLEHRGWVQFRKGSGVYVRELNVDATADPKLELDQLISTLFQVARQRGHSLHEIQSRVKHWLETQPPDHILLIEPDEELRSILIAEIEAATGFRVRGTGIEECARAEVLAAAAIDPDAMSFRDARESGWQKGLASSAMVITDALTATLIPDGCRTRVFRIIADSSLDELRSFKDFLAKPLG